MSHFVFGLVELSQEKNTRAIVLREMSMCAAHIGFALNPQERSEPTIVSEMRGKFSPDLQLPFVCVTDNLTDNSDGIISPHLLGIEVACRGLANIARWVECVLQKRGVHCVLIWFVEGFDDAFEHHECPVEKLYTLISGRMRTDYAVPSMMVRVSP